MVGQADVPLHPHIDAGADINAADKAEDTPLHLAAAHAQFLITETVKLLLAWGADVMVANNAGETVGEVAEVDDSGERVLLCP